jgi:hypothetical protein
MQPRRPRPRPRQFTTFAAVCVAPGAGLLYVGCSPADDKPESRLYAALNDDGRLEHGFYAGPPAPVAAETHIIEKRKRPRPPARPSMSFSGRPRAASPPGRRLSVSPDRALTSYRRASVVSQAGVSPECGLQPVQSTRYLQGRRESLPQTQRHPDMAAAAAAAAAAVQRPRDADRPAVLVRARGLTFVADTGGHCLQVERGVGRASGGVERLGTGPGVTGPGVWLHEFLNRPLP